jgi:hypothetical protein
MGDVELVFSRIHHLPSATEQGKLGFVHIHRILPAMDDAGRREQRRRVERGGEENGGVFLFLSTQSGSCVRSGMEVVPRQVFTGFILAWRRLEGPIFFGAGWVEDVPWDTTMSLSLYNQ